MLSIRDCAHAPVPPRHLLNSHVVAKLDVEEKLPGWLAAAASSPRKKSCWRKPCAAASKLWWKYFRWPILWHSGVDQLLAHFEIGERWPVEVAAMPFSAAVREILHQHNRHFAAAKQRSDAAIDEETPGGARALKLPSILICWTRGKLIPIIPPPSCAAARDGTIP